MMLSVCINVVHICLCPKARPVHSHILLLELLIFVSGCYDQTCNNWSSSAEVNEIDRFILFGEQGQGIGYKTANQCIGNIAQHQLQSPPLELVHWLLTNFEHNPLNLPPAALAQSLQLSIFPTSTELVVGLSVLMLTIMKCLQASLGVSATDPFNWTLADDYNTVRHISNPYF